jgi:hypothetical protein
MEARRSGLILSRALLAFALATTTLLGAGWRRASAAAPPAITIVQAVADDDFPNQLRFEIVAQSIAQITSVRLAYRVSDDPVITVDSATFAPGNRVDASRTIDLKQEYVPPGVTLHVQWQIQDLSGGELDTPWADVAVTDRRFLWHQSNQGGVTLHWYDGDTQYSDAMLSTAATALANAQRDLGVSSSVPVDVYLYANEQDFRSTLVTGSSSWVGGETYPTYHDVVLLAPSTDLANSERSVAHEMTHVAIDSGDDSPFGPLPTWLDEGLAMVAEGQTDPVFVQALQTAESAHHLMSIQSLSGNFPDSTDQATLAYAESDSLVRYFIQTYGKQKIGLLIAGFRQGETSDKAFQQSIGQTTLQFQQAWLASLGQPANTSAAPASSSSGSSVLRVLTAPVDFVIRLVGDVVQRLLAGKQSS